MNENAYTSMENAIGEIKVGQKSAEAKTKYTKTDGIFAILYMALGFTFIRFFLYYDWGTNFGFTLPLYTIAYITVVIFYAKAKAVEISKESLFWIGAMACVALMFKIEYFFQLVVQIMLAAYFTATVGGLYGGGTSAYICADTLHIAIYAPFSHLFSIFPAFFTLFKRENKKEKTSIHPAVWGGLMAVGALWVIVPLLIKADSNFLSGTTEFISHLFAGANLLSIVINILFSVPVACYLYSMAYCSVNHTGRIFSKEELDIHRENLRLSPAVTLKVFMLVICAVYVLFIALQADYLLGAFTGRLYSGYTYAEYARTGFFELCKVSVINLSLLAICNLLIKKDERHNIKKPMLMLCVLSLLLLSTATAKMVMYISVYGLTVKRVISTVFLLWLVCVFVMCIARLYKEYNLVKVALLTGVVMFCVLFSIDLGEASYNFNERYGFSNEIQAETTSEIRLPNALNVGHITVLHSIDSDYAYYLHNDALTINKFYKIAGNSVLTDIESVQDFPALTDDYYIITIHSDIMYVEDDTTLYCYNIDGTTYLEQPYNGIWVCESNLYEMFGNCSFQ